MRIVMVTDSLGGGYGTERVVALSTALLRRAGHDVAFVAASNRAADESAVLVLPELFRKHWLLPRRALAAETEALDRFLGALRPDVLHFVDQPEPRLAARLARRYPSVLSAHTVALTCPASHRLIRGGGACGKKSGWGCLWHQRRYHCLDYLKGDLRRAHAIENYLRKRRAFGPRTFVAAISRYVRDLCVLDGWDGARVAWVPNPVTVPETALFTGAPENLVVTASRLAALKGIDHGLRALALVRDLPWTYWIVGDGPEGEKLRRLTGELGLAERVRFLGARPHGETVSVVAAAAVALQANTGPEAFGMAVAEASYLGRPVVGYRMPALDEIVRHGETGWLAEPGSVEALAGALREALGDRERARRLGAEGARWIRSAFSGERHLGEQVRIYEAAIASGKSS